jgi:hypothetical protein
MFFWREGKGVLNNFFWAEVGIFTIEGPSARSFVRDM